MSEEKIEKAEEKPVKEKAETGEQKKPEPVQEIKPAAEVKAADKPQEKKPQEKPEASNCATCGKVLKHRMWYYRNMKFYCNKRCWKKSTEKVA